MILLKPRIRVAQDISLVTAPTHFLEGIREEIEKNYKVTYAYGASYSH